jgi:hypothetical protein
VLEKPTIAQLIKKFHDFCENLWLITMSQESAIGPFLSQLNAVHALTASLLKILFFSFRDKILWPFQIQNKFLRV